ncbi:hypothetical protein CRE_13495 [Caenorhabditis remanei]|uniref:Uncharacterized protein n=1 Tax=Caenorhabditis remanei TaxID=31234 RepID=E3MRA7_CAERE|nr:hypothetical protein CRE_13495 [Caenorhabditis remanei]
MILLVGAVEPVRDLNSLTNLKEFFREVQGRAREKSGRTHPTREFLGFANDGSSFRNPLSTGGGFRTGRSIIWKTSELPSIRGIDRLPQKSKNVTKTVRQKRQLLPNIRQPFHR